MGKVTRHLEGRTREDRIRTRRARGTLKQLTVQPSTRARYDKALKKFASYLAEENITLPTNKLYLDLVVSDYIEHLWISGEGKALASDSLAAIQDKQPQVRHQLLGSWRLLKTWSISELPNRAPPLPENALQCLVGYALFKQWPQFALSLLTAYYGMLRTGEVLSLSPANVTCMGPHRPLVISLGLTKGGKRAGAAESITLGIEEITRRWYQLTHVKKSPHYLCPAAHVWRGMFSSCLEGCGFADLGFRPYSLRRGGATFWFHQHNSFDRLLVDGRWQSIRTARTYVNEGLALLAETTLPWNASNKSYLSYYHRCKNKPLPKLELPGR